MDSNFDSVSITINPVNDALAADNQVRSTNENTIVKRRMNLLSHCEPSFTSSFKEIREAEGAEIIADGPPFLVSFLLIEILLSINESSSITVSLGAGLRQQCVTIFA